MGNFDESAYAFTAVHDGENTNVHYGFTKLELAALIIAQGICADGRYTPNQYVGYIAEPAVAVAKAVLEEANK